MLQNTCLKNFYIFLFIFEGLDKKQNEMIAETNLNIEIKTESTSPSSAPPEKKIRLK